MERFLAVELAATLQCDAQGEVQDTLTELSGWVRAQAELLPTTLSADEVPQDETTRRQLVEVRTAVRALFAHAVANQPPALDLTRPLSVEMAVHQVNVAAAAAPQVSRLAWPEAGEPHAEQVFLAQDRRSALLAVIANSTVELLSGPLRSRLRACPAPRCLHYFVQAHPRQQWCTPSCGNRTRVARYYQRHLPA